jgi:deoxycytidine triphosphate deaminase
VLLSDRDIKKEVESGRVRLDPYTPELIQPASIDVRLDRYFRVFENHRYPHIDPAEEQPDLTRMVEPAGAEPFVLHPGEFVLASTYEVVSLPDDIAGRLEGKALAIDTPVPTPGGWRCMGALSPGDEVFDEAGRPATVVAATPVLLGRPCREVVFSDGQSLVADLSHGWVTRTRAERRHGRPGSVRTTGEIAESLRAGDEWNHHIPLAGPPRYPNQALPADPYELGLRLGAPAVTGPTVTRPTMTSAATTSPAMSDGRLPGLYLRSSVGQRAELLRGLMDSGGHVDGYGRNEFVSVDESLADAVFELAAGLSCRPVKRKVTVTRCGMELQPAFRVRFTRPGRLQRSRAIVAVREVSSRPVRCIQVSSRNGQFLAGPAFIPTHNSSLGRLGLLTHSTAGWIDPGFSGHVTLELSNVATLPIKLWPGMKIGQLCLFRCSSPTEHPYGSPLYGSRYQDQRGPTPSRSYLNFYRTDV